MAAQPAASVEQRALRLVDQVERVANRVWWAPSQSGGEGHVVAVVDGAWCCDCRGFEWRQSCAHVEAVRAWIQKAKARPA